MLPLVIIGLLILASFLAHHHLSKVRCWKIEHNRRESCYIIGTLRHYGAVENIFKMYSTECWCLFRVSLSEVFEEIGKEKASLAIEQIVRGKETCVILDPD